MAFAASSTGCILVSDDTGTTTLTNGDGDGDGDGDGTGTTTGDGDGDGDTTGDGDGDDTTGDGDGDPGTGDGDGDGDGDAPSCGWLEAEMYYGCGGVGEDPGGAPMGCPDGLVAGEDCESVEPALDDLGCCDANGNNWYCGDDGMTVAIVEEVCG
ncbi:hypothetical protein DB30_07084 [Enhygromyxa salina]|uniref:Endo-1,4-beta-xylanase A n=2 Tax=Enhygromyxa salina TaxID=215803 RepID=A0A0C1ZSX7_9BACT|nr:hypothetical protein DB30_07084 [Enhygromyxa salina]